MERRSVPEIRCVANCDIGAFRNVVPAGCTHPLARWNPSFTGAKSAGAIGRAPGKVGCGAGYGLYAVRSKGAATVAWYRDFHEAGRCGWLDQLFGPGCLAMSELVVPRPPTARIRRSHAPRR